MINNNKNILIVEDNFFNRLHIVSNLKKQGINFVYHVDSVDDALNLLFKIKIDLCIIDINLGENKKDGVVLGEFLFDNFNIPFIYLTAYDDPKAISKALVTQPYAYLTKPVNIAELYANINLALKNNIQKGFTQKKLLLKNKLKEYEYIEINDIQYIESKGNYLHFYTETEEYHLRSTIKDFINNLPEYFIRCHRGFIVNKYFITKFTKTNINIGNKTIPVSRNFADDIMKFLN